MLIAKVAACIDSFTNHATKSEGKGRSFGGNTSDSWLDEPPVSHHYLTNQMKPQQLVKEANKCHVASESFKSFS